MKLKTNPPIEIKECKTLKDRLKSLRFNLNKLDYALYFPNKKLASTYFFCQRVDICFIDKDNKIIALYENIKSEKRILKLKAKGVLYLPLGYAKKLKVGEKIY